MRDGEGRRAGGEVLVSLRSIDDREGRSEWGEWEEGVGMIRAIRARMRFRSLGRGERGEGLTGMVGGG